MKLQLLKQVLVRLLLMATFVHGGIGIIEEEQGVIETETLLVQQVNEDGFGDRTNQYSWSMASFKGDLYVGTLNARNGLPSMAAFFAGVRFQTNGADIYRGIRSEDDGTWSWEQVVDAGNGNEHNYGVRNIEVVGQFLYGVTANYVNGFELLRTSDGLNWETVMEDGFGSEENTSGRGLKAYNGYLYVGSENRREGAEIWRRAVNVDGDFVDNSSWERVISGGLGDAGNIWFSDFVEYNGYLYTGTLNIVKGAELHRTSDGINYQRVFRRGNGEITNTGVMKLAVFQDRLFVGTMNFKGGASLFANSDTDGMEFELIFGNGYRHWSNVYVWSMKEFNDRLYVGTFKQLGNFDVLSSGDPGNEDFVVETHTGFKNRNHYGARCMVVHDGRLIVGSATEKFLDATKVFEAEPII